VEWVVVATSPHINCFCFFLNDLQVNLSVSGCYLLSCRKDNLGKIWLIVRVTWVAVVFVAPLTKHNFFCLFLFRQFARNLSVLNPFYFRAEIRHNLHKVWQTIGCQGNTRGVAIESVKTSLNRLGASDIEWQSIPEPWSSTSEGPIAKCCFGYETGITTE